MRSTENKELETKRSLISRTHPYIYKTRHILYIYTHIYMKDKGAEFPKKPCVQIHTNVLHVAVNNAKSRRAPRLPLLKTTAKYRREK